MEYSIFETRGLYLSLGLIICMLLARCDENTAIDGQKNITSGTTKPKMDSIDFSILDPTKIGLTYFEDPIFKTDFVFQTSTPPQRFKIQNTSEEKGLWLKKNKIWVKFEAWYYFENAKLIRIDVYKPNHGKQKEYLYDKNGRLRLEKEFNEEGENTMRVKYSSDGEVLEKKCFSENTEIKCLEYLSYCQREPRR